MEVSRIEGYSLEVLVAYIQVNKVGDRFIAETCTVVFRVDFEYKRLLSLARYGVTVVFLEGFSLQMESEVPWKLLRQLNLVNPKYAFTVCGKEEWGDMRHGELSHGVREKLNYNSPHKTPTYIPRVCEGLDLVVVYWLMGACF